MAEAGHDLRFLLKLAPKLSQGLMIQAWLGDHLLEGDRDIKASVPRAIDCPHPTLAQQGDDAIAALQHLSGSERHVSPRSPRPTTQPHHGASIQ